MNLQDIENKIRTMNPAAFQELGDAFMMKKYKDSTLFYTKGSQYGKQKTIKGTPDTEIHTKDNKCIMVEYSTNETKGIQKLSKDIDKCIKKECIAKLKKSITLIVSYKLKDADISHIINYANENDIDCIIYDGARLARELYDNNYNDIICKYLNIPIDNRQILSIEDFIQEYINTAGVIFVSLSNKFLCRESELTDIKTYLNEYDFVLLYGAPGVGKTRLAIQSILEYCKENTNYYAYCISDKGSELSQDFYNINLENDNILFVDDINKIDNKFKSIIGFYSNKKTGKLKIVMTVRDYALQQAKKLYRPHDCMEIQVEPMNTEQIYEIIKTEFDFDIFNIDKYEILDNIIINSKGNLRIAMMLGKLVTKKQNLKLFDNISKVFDYYYSDIIDIDKQHINKNIFLQCSGIIAFFSPMKYKYFSKIIKTFHINPLDFENCLNILKDKKIAIIYNNTYVKINDQNLRMYLFYLAFIKEKVLPIEILFQRYYKKEAHQIFIDCIFSINVFDPNIKNTITSILSDYYNSLKNYEVKFLFLLDFWSYLQLETLDFIWDSVFKNKYELNSNFDILKLTSMLFTLDGSNLEFAIKLAFEYVRRKNDAKETLIHYIDEYFNFRHNDINNSHYRQSKLLEYIIEQVEQDDLLCNQIFWYIARLFLTFRTSYFEHSGEIINRIYQYQVPPLKSILNIREKIWNIINKYYSFENFNGLLQKYISSYSNNIELLKHDNPNILKIIKEHANSKSFDDCLCVQKYIQWSKKRNVISQKDYKDFYNKFQCSEYKFYELLTWDRLRDNELYDDNNNYDAYKKYKKTKFKKKFVYKTKQSYNKFLKKYTGLLKNTNIDTKYKNTLKDSLNLIVSKAFDSNNDLGYYFIKEIIQYDFLDFIPLELFANHLNTSKSEAKKIMSAIQSADFYMKSEWIIKYYEFISAQFLTEKDSTILLKTIENCSTRASINISNLVKFKKFDSKFIDKILKLILELNKHGKSILICLYNSEFMYDICSKDVIQQTYLQQLKLQKNYDYDYDGKVFFRILKDDPHFLLEYIKIIANNETNPDLSLSQIWKVEGIESAVDKVLKYLRTDYKYSNFREYKWEKALFMFFKNNKTEVNNEQNKKSKNIFGESV